MKNGRLLPADRHLGVLGGQQGLLQDLFDTSPAARAKSDYPHPRVG